MNMIASCAEASDDACGSRAEMSVHTEANHACFVLEIKLMPDSGQTYPRLLMRRLARSRQDAAAVLLR